VSFFRLIILRFILLCILIIRRLVRIFFFFLFLSSEASFLHQGFHIVSTNVKSQVVNDAFHEIGGHNVLQVRRLLHFGLFFLFLWLFLFCHRELDSLVEVVLLVVLFFLSWGNLGSSGWWRGLWSISGWLVLCRLCLFFSSSLSCTFFFHRDFEGHGKLRVHIRVDASELSELTTSDSWSTWPIDNHASATVSRDVAAHTTGILTVKDWRCEEHISDHLDTKGNVQEVAQVAVVSGIDESLKSRDVLGVRKVDDVNVDSISLQTLAKLFACGFVFFDGVTDKDDDSLLLVLVHAMLE